MRWWKRRGRHRADEALEEARKERKEANERGEEIKTIASRLRAIRDENHFAENIRRALGEG